MSVGRYGIVTIAALDLRAAPDHRSELESQLLLGETVRQLRTRSGGQWWEVEGRFDGDRGWIRSWGIRPVSARTLQHWERVATARISALTVEARDRAGSGRVVTPLYWMSRAIPLRRSGKSQELRLPDGRKVWIPIAALAPKPGKSPIAERIESLAGAPYLWGGRTPSGIDCSGLTQLVMAERGWRIPRDADQQWRASRRITSRAQARPGDLVFFGRRGEGISHVGVWLGGGRYGHARGIVQIASLDPGNRRYDRALKAQFRGFGRPVLRHDPEGSTPG